MVLDLKFNGYHYAEILCRLSLLLMTHYVRKDWQGLWQKHWMRLQRHTCQVHIDPVSVLLYVDLCSLCCYPLKAILRWLGYPFTQCDFLSGLFDHPWIPIGCFAYKFSKFLSTCGAILEVVFEFEWRATYFGSLTTKVILAPLGMPKWVWPSMNRYRMFFIQPSTILPSMHQKLGKWKSACKLTNSCPKVALS